jgi:uncharacterized membrane protein YbaN (DUF454 family)
MINKLKKIGILTLGWLFIVLGVLGPFLPILQGILFILIGLSILSSRSMLVKRFLNRIEKRFPRHLEQIEIWKERVRGWVKQP